MTTPRCSVVVPVIPAHTKYIKALLEELSPAKNKILEIIFCASSQSDKSAQDLAVIVGNSVFNGMVFIESTKKRVTAGVNRNLGWSRAKGEYVCFLDADDSYNPQMFSIFEYYFETLGCDLILHDYFRLSPQFVLRMRRSFKKLKVVDSKVLLEQTFGKTSNSVEPNSNQKVNTNLRLPAKMRFLHRIQHGHATVKKDVPIRYSNRPVGEDGEFAQEMLLQGYRVVYLPLRLSNYDRPTFSNITKSLFLRFVERISKVKGILILIYRYFSTRNFRK